MFRDWSQFAETVEGGDSSAEHFGVHIEGSDDGYFLDDLVVDGLYFLIDIVVKLYAFLGSLSLFKRCEITNRVEIIAIFDLLLDFRLLHPFI